MKKILLIVSTAIYIFIPELLLSQSTWSWQQPYPCGNFLRDVKMVSADTIYACGTMGTVMKTTNAGANWNVLTTNTHAHLCSIDFLDANTGIAAGDSGIAIKTTNGGLSWSKQTFTANIFRGVDFVENSKHVFMVSYDGYIYKSTNAGESWSTGQSGTGGYFTAVKFRDTLNGYYCGIGFYGKTTNGGNNWTVYPVAGFLPYLSDISIADSLNVFILLNGNYIIKSIDGGNNWVTINAYIPHQNPCCDLARAINFVNRDTGMIITSYGLIGRTTDSGNSWDYDNTFYKYNFVISVFDQFDNSDDSIFTVVGYGGNILRTNNYGRSLKVQNGFMKELICNYFVTEQIGFIVGDSGKVLKTTDKGLSWKLKNTQTTRKLNSIHFPSSNVGYIAGDSGSILKSTDGGENWQMQNSGINPGEFSDFNDIFFLNETSGIVGGERYPLLKTTDGGNNWYLMRLPEFGGHISSVYMINDSVYLGSSDDNIFRTSNSGQTWNSVGNNTTGRGYCFSFTDSINGFCVSTNQGIYKTTNAGLNWTQSVIPGSLSTRLLSIQCLNDSISYACGSEGAIIKSTNGGLNWSFLPRITDNKLNSIQFINLNTGFIVGEFGTILKTTNGGLSFTGQNSSVFIEDYLLSQNYPNPFNPHTKITYKIKKSGIVKLFFYDTGGKVVTELVNEFQNAGEYNVSFNGTNIPSGIYFYSLNLNGKDVITKKCVLIK